ncbi:MAG: tyrosine-type recombinase/integrase [Bacteroidia bacterium]
MLTACSIKFYLRPDRKKKDGADPVWVRIIVNRRKAELFTYHFADPKKWDSQSGRQKGSTRQNNYLNYKLASIETKVWELRDSMEKKGKQLSIVDVRSMLKDGSKPNDMTYLEFFKKHINKIKLNPNEYGSTVVKQYETTMSHFTGYLASIGQKQLLLRELNINNLTGFEEYLLTEYINPTLQRRMIRSTSNKYLSRIRTVLNSAVRSGAIDRSPFQMGFKLKNTKVHSDILTMEEIETIANHSLGNIPSLDRARSLFLFECFTGIRWSDLQLLRSDNVKFDKKSNRYWVVIRQKKTGEVLEIPLISKAMEIYDKYKAYREATGFVLPRLSNQKVNSYLRVICELTGITKKVTSHTGRRTFATTVLQESGEIDIATISKLLGHTSIKSTSLYARVSRKLLANVAEKVDGKQQNVVKPDICLN